jgi:hypothetical protein
MATDYSLSEKIAIVTAAAQVHGKPMARRLWRELGLPETGADAPPPVAGNLVAFMDEMIMPSPGGIVFARAMYRAYVGWCAVRGEAPVSEKVFGTRLPRLGAVKLRKRVREYRDVQLRDTMLVPNHDWRRAGPAGERRGH